MYIIFCKIETIFRGAQGTTCAAEARCRVLRRGSWGPSMDPARSGGRATRPFRERDRSLSLKTFVKSSFWVIPAGSLLPIRGPSRPAQGQGRLVAGVEHSSAPRQIFFGAHLAEFQRKQFWMFWTLCARSVANSVLICWRPRRCTSVLPAQRCPNGP
jgi:hypothetical protein